MTFTPENGTTLCGWFLKEKRDKFKRRQSIVSTSSNRRWFQIEKLGAGGENALCYYKRQPKPKKDEKPIGFFFLNDITSLSQDINKKLITLEHPSRILRIVSPSLAQHTYSYSALVRSCHKATKPELSLDGIGNSTPSHSFYASSSSSLAPATARRNSLGETATAKDELKFLREITGNNNLVLSHSSSSSSDSRIRDTSDSSSESDKENFVPLSTTEEEKSAVEPLYYHGNGREDDGTEGAFSVEKMIAALPDMATSKSNSFASHQIQRSSSYRHHFGDDDIQPDADFLHDDWDN